MAVRTLRLVAEGEVDVAILAVEFKVQLIQRHAGDRVFEIILVPAAVAGRALPVQLRDPATGRVTGSAFCPLVITAERPAGGTVLEGRLLFGVMTLVTVIINMAVITHGVDLFLRLGGFFGLLDVMAVTAVFLPVTVDTAEPEQVDMLLVLERDNRLLFVRRVVDFCHRLGDNRVGDTDNVG